eukprot:4720214-Pyramimonas_sp.AAC.1
MTIIKQETPWRLASVTAAGAAGLSGRLLGVRMPRHLQEEGRTENPRRQAHRRQHQAQRVRDPGVAR